jgi:hypothetical protein
MWGNRHINFDFAHYQNSYKRLYLFYTCRIRFLSFDCLSRRRLLSMETFKSLRESLKTIFGYEWAL